MKKIFIGVALMLSAMTVNAQIGQGKLFINGEFGISSKSFENDSDHKYSTVSITPSVGYFITDQFALGLGVGISSTRDKNTNNTVTITDAYSRINISPFARYYVPTAGDKFHFFVQSRLGFAFDSRNYKTESGNNSVTRTTKENSINFRISPGFAYFPSDHWSVELLLKGFYIDQENPSGTSKETTVGLNINSLSPSIGVSYFF